MTASPGSIAKTSEQHERTPEPSAGVWRTIVGVDGSEESLAALAWAVTETRLRGGTVHAVMAWQRPAVYGSGTVMGLGMDPSYETQAELASGIAAEAARAGGQADPALHVTITSAAVEGNPASALLAAAEGADLLVVGTRGHGGFVGALLGSVSQHVVTHAPCPVVVVPDSHRLDSR